MTAVPLATELAITGRPVAATNASRTSAGKPCGYVGNAFSRCSPAISQCPVVESFPRRPREHGPPACLRIGYGFDPLDRREVAQAKPFEVGQRQPAHRTRDVPQGIAPLIAIRRRIRCGAAAHAIQHENEGPPGHAGAPEEWLVWLSVWSTVASK